MASIEAAGTSIVARMGGIKENIRVVGVTIANRSRESVSLAYTRRGPVFILGFTSKRGTESDLRDPVHGMNWKGDRHERKCH